MKIALVHDFLAEYGGAERVLEALTEIWPKAPIYTAFYKEGGSAYERFKKKDIRASWAHKIPFFASFLHSPLRFLAPLIWGSFSAKGGPSFGWDFSEYDVVLASSSWFITKGFKKKSNKSNKGNKGDKGYLEVCYCHTPPRYLYGYKTAVDWQKFFPVRVYALIVNHFMRVYDYEAAQRVDYFIANSQEVAARIKKFYRRDSEVIYPPVDLTRDQRLETRDQRKKKSGNGPLETGYYLVVSRLVSAKNVDLIVEVCTKLDLPLKVVGTGREMKALEELATRDQRPETRDHVQFLGEVSDSELVDLYQNCRAVIFAASQEDFGLVPVEAMAAGKPVIALAEGGVLESVINGKTGVYFSQADSDSLTQAIKNFEKLEKKGVFDPKTIRRHAQKFSKERFKREIQKFVESKLK